MVFVDCISGTDTQFCGTMEDPCLTISFSVSQCNQTSDNCFIGLFPGTYSSDDNTNVVLPEKLTLIGLCEYIYNL